MGNRNAVFLEEYKRLDKICREMYSSERGVTAYIDDMKRVSTHESRTISNWNADLHQLISLRHLRNRLTHECGTLEQEICSQSDIDWIKMFYGRVLRQSDPVALLEKSRRKVQKRNTDYQYNRATPDLKSGKFGKQDSMQRTDTQNSVASTVFAVIVLLLVVLYVLTVMRILR